MSKYSKYYVCMYDNNKELITSRAMSCKGCAKKRMPKDTPACIRGGSKTGNILVYNEAFKKLFNYKGRNE